MKNTKLYRNLKKIKFLRNIIVRLKHKTFSRNIQKNGLKVISLLSEAFREKEIGIALNYGTLLGIYRDKGLIKHDVDIDLILFKRKESLEKNIQVELARFIENYDHRIKSVFFFPKKGLFKLNVLNCMIDILIVNYDFNSNSYYFLSNQNIIISDFVKFEALPNKIYLIPDNVEEILEYHYGPKWSVPDKYAYEFRKK